MHLTEPPSPSPVQHAEPRAILHRLFVGLLIALGAALACWWIGPKLGFDLPWYVPVLAFAVIAVPALVPLLTRAPSPGPKTDPGPDPSDQSP
jgi:hypothetical protein